MENRSKKELDELLLKCDIALKEKNYGEALRIAKILKKNCPNKPSYVSRYANSLYSYSRSINDEKGIKKTISYLNEKLYTEVNKYGDVALSLLFVLCSEERYNEAENILLNNIENIKDEREISRCMYYMGCINLSKEDEKSKESAKRAFKSSLDIFPKMYSSASKLLSIAYQERNVDDINKYFLICVEELDDEETANYYLSKAIKMSEMCVFEQAKIDYAFALCDKISDVDVSLVETLFKNKKYKELCKELKKINGNYDFKSYIMALIDIDKNNKKGFVSNIDKISNSLTKSEMLRSLILISQKSNDSFISSALDQCNSIFCLDDLSLKLNYIKKMSVDGKFEEALSLIEQLEHDDSDDFRILIEKGKILVHLNRIDEAEEMLYSLIKKGIVNAYIELVNLYIKCGNIDIAEHLLCYVPEKGPYYLAKKIEIELYKNDLDKAGFDLKQGMNYENNKLIFTPFKVILAIKNKNFDTARYYCNVMLEKETNDSKIEKINDTLYYIDYLEGKDIKPRRDSYFQNQLYNYDKNVAIEHVAKHFKDCDYKNIHTKFNGLCTPEQIYKEARERINKKIPHECDTFADFYVIELDHYVAEINGVKTNKIKVVTVFDTTNILTIYPLFSTGMCKEDIKKRIKN